MKYETTHMRHHRRKDGKWLASNFDVYPKESRHKAVPS